jgi:replicative DNA helicase
MADIIKSIGDIPINVDNEGLIIANAMKSAVNRETFIKRVNWQEFRMKEYQSIAYGIITAAEEGATVEPSMVSLKSRGCPIRFYLDADSIDNLLNKYKEVTANDFNVHLDTLRLDNVRASIEMAMQDSLAKTLLDPTSKLGDIEERIQLLNEIVQRGYSVSRSEFKSMDEVIDDFIIERETGVFHRTTGFRQLDELLTGGFKDKEISIICGRPSMGKSSFTLSLMKNLSNKGVVAPQFALEMPNMSITTKLLAFNSDIAIKKIAGDWEKLTSTEQDIIHNELLRLRQNQGIYLNDKPSQSLAEIREQIMLLQDKLKTTYMVVFIDLFGKIRDFQDSDNFASDYEKKLNVVQVMTRGLGVHMGLVAQIRRSTTRKNQRPKMSEIKNAGAWEEVADNIFGLHRENYDPDVAFQQQIAYGEEHSDMSFNPEDNIAELLLLKGRMSGNNKILYMYFNPITTRFGMFDSAYQHELRERMRFNEPE